MSDTLRDKLRSEILPTGWSDLAPHFARGALLLAGPELDLLEAAVAIATDDADQVQGWLATSTLRRAEERDATAWAEGSPRFQFVILQPWVLAQALPDSPSR